jgi:hypothetical protein
MLVDVYKVPALVSLAVIISVLTVAFYLSYLANKRDAIASGEPHEAVTT